MMEICLNNWNIEYVWLWPTGLDPRQCFWFDSTESIADSTQSIADFLRINTRQYDKSFCFV